MKMSLMKRQTRHHQGSVLHTVLSVFSVGKPGKVQRRRVRMFRMRCIVMDTWPGRSSVLNHRRIGGPRLCLRPDPKQSRERSGYYSAAPGVWRPPLHAATHSQLAPRTHNIAPLCLFIPLPPSPLLPRVEGGFQAFRSFHTLNSH